ncbi:peptide/nickel transport system substrate-binding protein [Bradyrhizobium sp. USDA 4532]|uniref:ABC transporter substrate-binding protein n=1 Tax=unclassified Bradyrhizobium TaxID=2631580 RepID=UPI0020A0F22E|nr:MULTISPECIES: ABC transporter substrate-binding protein [unclassified Bradyrhizobium]MCP1835630.1 peptide/nickel transport system substrate-binding protein [Bradyrhizobium sp. USDA 4545]MCP1920379.1 peptide/nickel transport system substrate-binding protein [Bradyrhizobium sp. USDA 4532]
MSRRQMMNLLVAAGMSIADGAVATFNPVYAQTPRRGGKIKIATAASSTGETLDPAKGLNHTDYSRAFMFYNGLTVLDETLTPQLCLAEEIASSERATAWNIKLRDDVRFHDGSPLSSADVVYSLQRHKDPSLGSPVRSLAMLMEEITATGPREVRIRLSGPNADLPAMLGYWHFLIAKYGATDFRTANGTGPYKCQEFQPGASSIAVRNPEYFKSGKPYLDEIELFGITDELARVDALLSGDVHFISAINPRSAQRIISAPNLSLFETKANGYQDLALRLDQTPGSNPDFVLAIKHMFNREQIRRVVYRNFAVVANDQPIDPTNRFYNWSLPQRPFDLDKARFHLQRSRFAHQTFPIVVSPAALSSEEIAQLLQQSGRQIGLNFDLQRVPADGYWSNHWMKHPIGFSNTQPKLSADLAFSLGFATKAPWNESALHNDRFDQLLLEARAETDNDRRHQMYGEMQRLVHEGSGVCIPVFATILDAHVRQVQGLTAIPTGGMMGFNFAESIWLDQ